MSVDNSEQIEFWNGKAGDVWVEAQARLDRMLEPLSAKALEVANVQNGERVIDIGCGCGTTSIALNQHGGHVWGVDISAPMLAHAKHRAANLENIAFSESDAAVQAYTPDHQLVFSRFGVMFFADPVAAFSNIRTALTADGRLVFVCWQAPRSNPWVSIGGAAVQPFLPKSDVAPDPRAPGPFAFADSAYLTDILTQAGYADIKIEGFEAQLHYANNIEEAMQFQGEVGPVARVLSELQGDLKQAALDAAEKALLEHMTADGLNLGSAVWIVSARAQ